MDQPDRRPPKRNEDRIILQFDYDCFYAQVYENKNPALKSKPVGIKQKNILATCNYNARAQGVRKLMLVTDARQACPELVLVDGEDLTPFRDVSKTLFGFLKAHSWNGKVERLGFDEVFMDVTDIVDYNMSCMNRGTLNNSLFYLSKKNPELGFPCDFTSVVGCVEGTYPTDVDLQTPRYLRLMLGSHLAKYLRTKLEEDFGYTSTCGISTNKVLSKLIGSKNKPRNQTTLLALNDDDATTFMDSHSIRSIPGIGSRTESLLEAHIAGQEALMDSHKFDSTVTAGQVRSASTVSPAFLEKLLIGPGAERGIGTRIWSLLHGVDPMEVKKASDIATQISIEDTYKGLETMSRIIEELHKLSCSLVRRMRVDLLSDDENADLYGAKKWLARPRTLRLSIRSWPQTGSLYSQSFSRTSRSGPVPSFIFETKVDIEHIAERLVSETLVPLLRRLSGEKGQKWNLQLINICVANMIPGAADDKTGVGRDIANMFRKQDEVLAPWRITMSPENMNNGDDESEESVFDDADSGEAWETTEQSICPECRHSIPSFALPAHLRYHEMGE